MKFDVKYSEKHELLSYIFRKAGNSMSYV